MSRSLQIGSKGTYDYTQHFSSYPYGLYGDCIPLDERMFQRYFKDEYGHYQAQPVASGFSIEKYYAPAGGVNDLDLSERFKIPPECHPILPPYQNQYSCHSHYQDMFYSC